MAKAVVTIDGLIGDWEDQKGVKLLDVISQVKQQGTFDALEVRIRSSIGGVVQDGLDIYKYLRNVGVPVTTVVENYCASIASIIFLAGDTRLMRDGSQLMIHNPWARPEGDADTLEGFAAELRTVEKNLIGIYAERTGIGKEVVSLMLRDETEMSAQEAVAIGFATGIEQGAVEPQAAGLKIVAYLKHNSMTNKKKSLKDQLKTVLAKLAGEAVALKLQDATGKEVEFDTEAEAPAVGDKATIDGAPAEGEIVMPDGRTFVFAAGELTEIKDAPADPVLPEDLAAAVAKAVKAEMALALKEMKEENELATQAIVNLSTKYEALARGVKSTYKVEPTQGRNNAGGKGVDPVYAKYQLKQKEGK
jgi:ATP-dependent protease ClpP protease subunit